MPPSTIPIVYEDRQLLICVKPAGILFRSGPGTRAARNLLPAQSSADFIAGVHRLNGMSAALWSFPAAQRSPAS